MKILNHAGKPNGSTTYMWDDKFYCLAAESFTGFDHYSKGLRVELALALLSDFWKRSLLPFLGVNQRVYGHLLDPICTAVNFCEK